MPVTRFDATFAPLMIAVVLAGVLSAAVWVYRDARAQARAGSPIVCTMGDLHIRTPWGWFLACALLFELFIPMYLDSRPAG